MNFSTPDIPARMHRNGRPVDPDFAPDELLYMRCRGEFIQGDRLSPLFIRGPGFPHIPNQSVNRGKYSKPGDVLIPAWLQWGIARLQVADVTFRILVSGTDNRSYKFSMLHTPEEENYAHSEIGAFDGESDVRVDTVTSKTRKEFRTIISQKAIIIKQAQR